MNNNLIIIVRKTLVAAVLLILLVNQSSSALSVLGATATPEVTASTGSTGGGQAHNNMQPYLSVNYIIAVTGVFPSRGPGGSPADGPMLGEIRLFAGNFAPRGWALCQGQLLPISSNQALFSILGTTYGGDGRTTFALPDLRGRVPIGVGQGAGLSNVILGQRSGGETATPTLQQLPSHTHAKPGGSTDETGSDQTHTNQQPYLAINYIVSTSGLFPPNDTIDFYETPYVGEIRMFAGNFAPSGYYLAQGQLMDIAQNTALFSVFGTTYGGDGRVTFGLPDLQGRTAIGEGTGPGLSPRPIGQKTGVESVQLTTQQIPAHAHSYAIAGGTGSAGGSQSHINMMPSLVLSYRIVTFGVYPSRNDAPTNSAGITAGDTQIGQLRILGFDRGSFQKADGSLIAVSSNDALFSILGTIYGGDGRTTFGLPDLRGRAPLGTGQGAGLSNRLLGARSGTESEFLTVATMPAHTHTSIGEIQCAVTAAGAYTFTTQSNVAIDVTSTGSNLACLYVEEVAGDHPNATPGIQTGKYWIIEGAMSDQLTPTTGDFNLSITLPHSVVPDANANVCKYTGTSQIWDCDRTSSDVTSVTRDGISALSEWAVGDNVGPTAVNLTQLGAGTRLYAVLVAAVAILLLTGAALILRPRKQHETQ